MERPSILLPIIRVKLFKYCYLDVGGFEVMMTDECALTEFDAESSLLIQGGNGKLNARTRQ